MLFILMLLRLSICRLLLLSSLHSSGVAHSLGEDLAMLLPDSLYIFWKWPSLGVFFIIKTLNGTAFAFLAANITF